MNGRWCAPRTTFSSCIGSASDGEPDTAIELGHAADAGTAIAEDSDPSRRRAAGGNVTVTAITRTNS